MQTVNFTFSLDQEVQLVINSRPGTVTGQFNDSRGQRFQVEYATEDGVVREGWFNPEKLTAR